MNTFEKHLSIDVSGSSAIDALSKGCPDISIRQLKQAMQFGAVWLSRTKSTDRIRRAKKQLCQGDELHIYFDEDILFSDITPAQLVADEQDYTIWNKPCGMYSQGTKWGDHTAICRWVELQGLTLNGLSPRPVFLVHRLDRATQGLILVAHSKTIAAKLADLFASRQIRKHYLATVKGQFPEDLLAQCINAPIEGKLASTRILDIKYDDSADKSTIRVQLETGRKHQIRRHFSDLGFPIIGDRLYGPEINHLNLPDLQLQSCYLEFECPVKHVNKKFCLAPVINS